LTPTTLASALASSLNSRVSTSSPRHSPPHRGLQSPGPSTSSTRTPPGGRSPNAATSASLSGVAGESTLSPLENAALHGGGGGNPLSLNTSSTFLGFNDWVTEESESDIMAQVLAMSQREFFEAQMSSPYRQVASSSMRGDTPPPSSSRDAVNDDNQRGGTKTSPRESKKRQQQQRRVTKGELKERNSGLYARARYLNASVLSFFGNSFLSFLLRNFLFVIFFSSPFFSRVCYFVARVKTRLMS